MDVLKQEYETLSIKLKELSEDELKQVTGGDFLEVMMKLSYGIRHMAEQVLDSSGVVSPEEILGEKRM